ncbi:hypothetical protein F4677DRAFT_289488 [Hypoxylon crocopeplum]|nr:hypothetical protein F4677DRAFT_289488 [Hypoxylon crocopeplum]
MESFFLASLNLGILVEKEVVVHTNNNANEVPTASHRTSVVSVVQSVPDLKRKPRTSEPLETSLSLPSAKMVPRPDVNDDGQEGLAEFFRRPPPPGNFMSIPDDLSISSVDKKWSVFRVFRKRRKGRRRRRRPPLITLPDSAVSARTTSGHRYIAISIPSEQSRSVSVQSLQRPVSRSGGAGLRRVADPRLGSAHTSTSDRGAKVLRPVTEDHESLSSVSLAPRSTTHPEEITWLAPPPRKVSLLSTVPSQEETPLGKGKEPDTRSKSESGAPSRAQMSPLGSVRTSYAAERGIRSPRRERGRQLEQQMTSESGGYEAEKAPRVVETLKSKRAERTSQQKQIARASNEQTTSDSSVAKGGMREASSSPGPSRVLSTNPVATLTLPVRTSSKRAHTTVAQPGETGHIIGNRSAPLSRAASSNNGGIGAGTGIGAATGPRGSFAESLITTESSPRVLKAETATAYQSVPIVVRPPSGPDIDSPLNLNFPAPPSNSVNQSVQADLVLPTPGAEGTASRKDRVRERKQRDIEKLRAQLRQVQSPASYLLKPQAPAEAAWPESPVLGRFTQELGSPGSSRPYLTAKMSDIGPIRPSLHLKSPHLSPEAVLKKRRGRSASVPAITSSSSTSLVSPSMPWEESTSYYRLRERQAEREENDARRARYAAQALVEEKESQDRLSRRKLVRRYERLKESRAKDMEKRLRRLERNDEVLMQSLVSMMDTLNKLMHEQTNTLQRSASSAHPTTTYVRQPHQGSAPGRAQSLRSVRSFDTPLDTLRSQPSQRGSRFQRNRPPSLRIPERERSIRGGELGTSSRREPNPSQEEAVRQLELGGAGDSALEAPQEQLQSQSQQSAQAPDIEGYSSTSSSDHSNKAGSLEIMEPLMRELQEAARFPSDQRQAETEAQGQATERRTSLHESDVFNLF